MLKQLTSSNLGLISPNSSNLIIPKLSSSISWETSLVFMREIQSPSQPFLANFKSISLKSNPKTNITPSASSMLMCRLISLPLSITKSRPTTKWIQGTSLNQAKGNRKREDHLEETESESMKRRQIQIERHHKQLRKKSTIQESTESIEEWERTQTIGQEKGLRSEFLRDLGNDKVIDQYLRMWLNFSFAIYTMRIGHLYSGKPSLSNC